MDKGEDYDDLTDMEKICELAKAITPNVIESLYEDVSRYSTNTTRQVIGRIGDCEIQIVVTNDPDETIEDECDVCGEALSKYADACHHCG